MTKYATWVAVATAGLLLAAAPASAQQASGRAGAAKDRGGIAKLGSNKDPINVDADKLDVFDREGRAVFAGNVVAVQGDSTMRCSVLSVFYEAGRGAAQAGIGGAAAGPAPAPATPAPATPAAAAPQRAPGSLPDNSAIKKITCKGPVTVVSKTQTATSDNAEFDRVLNKVMLVGNAALTDGPNVTRGERIVYDLNTGVANVESSPGRGGRVRALIVPGSGDTSGSRPR